MQKSVNKIVKETKKMEITAISLIIFATLTVIFAGSTAYYAVHNKKPKTEPLTTCPECNVVGGNHLNTCSLKPKNQPVQTEQTLQSIEVKPQAKPRIQHCAHCGKVGHYAKKCPQLLEVKV